MYGALLLANSELLAICSAQISNQGDGYVLIYHEAVSHSLFRKDIARRRR